MTEITLSEPTLVQAIETIAAHEGVDPTTYASRTLRHQIALYRQKRIAAESEAWYRMPAEQRKQYEGKYVAVFEGKIVGTDLDAVTLLYRMREQFGKQPILIVEGGDQPMPTYRIVSVKDASENAE